MGSHPRTVGWSKLKAVTRAIATTGVAPADQKASIGCSIKWKDNKAEPCPKRPTGYRKRPSLHGGLRPCGRNIFQKVEFPLHSLGPTLAPVAARLPIVPSPSPNALVRPATFPREPRARLECPQRSHRASDGQPTERSLTSPEKSERTLRPEIPCSRRLLPISASRVGGETRRIPTTSNDNVSKATHAAYTA